MKLLTLIFYDDVNHKNIQTLMVLTSITWRRCFGDFGDFENNEGKNKDISDDIDNCVKKKHLEEMFW